MTPLPKLHFIERTPMPGVLATQEAIREVAKDVASYARDVSEMRALDPRDRSAVVIVSTVGEYCALKGLVLPTSARDSEGKRVAILWTIASLIERVGLVRPALKGWAGDVAESALVSADDVLVVGVVFDATVADIERVRFEMPSAAAAGVTP